ncbi:GNAT family protein [Actinoallomurus sp. NPDC050550]|uniref:GNAT family N-acetyltransferase n=1 Tax=Actinoallomurus sp. NPDC050550 TaxID=3154937 RepID=UPI0033C33AE7
MTTAAKVEPRIEYSLAAALPSTGEVIGFARLAVDTQHAGPNSGQIGFALRPDVWGRGFGTETRTAAADARVRPPRLAPYLGSPRPRRRRLRSSHERARHGRRRPYPPSPARATIPPRSEA